MPRKKKRRSHNTSRSPTAGRNKQQRRALRFWSTLHTSQKWIVGTLLAGLSASVTAIMVSWTQPLQDHSEGIVASSTPFPGQMNGYNGPLFAVSVTNGFSACGPDSGWVYPASSRSLVSSAPGTGVKREGKTWDQNPQVFGAVPTSGEWVSITASGSSPTAIVIDNIKINVVSRRHARGLVANFMPANGCPVTGFEIASVNLDDSPPTITPIPRFKLNKRGIVMRTEPLLFPYTVTQSEATAFIFSIQTYKCDCAWTAEVDWTEGSRVGSTLIKDHGHPFETSAVDNLPTTSWTEFKGKWYKNWSPIPFPSSH